MYHDEDGPLVVKATMVSDVRATVDVVREADVPFVIRATGHGTHVLPDHGVLLDTSGMASVLVDPQRRVAKVGPGARWGAVLDAAAPYGLAPLNGSSPDVGVTGFTLGGGMGWLSRKYGYAADSVISAEVVTASGEILRASAGENPDLFWALRGGGGNFGVVTSLEFKLHDVPSVYGGVSYYSIERAAEVLAFYRDEAPSLPDELSTAVLLTTYEGKRALALKALYAGPASEGERVLSSLRRACGPALADGFTGTTWANAKMGGVAHPQMDAVNDIADEVIDALVEVDDANVEIRHFGGAIARPTVDAGPVGHRTSEFSITLDSPNQKVAKAIRPYATGESFLNFLSDTSRTADAYAPGDYEWLREVKASYDPDNFFSVGHNIRPVDVASIARDSAA